MLAQEIQMEEEKLAELLGKMDELEERVDFLNELIKEHDKAKNNIEQRRRAIQAQIQVTFYPLITFILTITITITMNLNRKTTENLK